MQTQGKEVMSPVILPLDHNIHREESSEAENCLDRRLVVQAPPPLPPGRIRNVYRRTPMVP